MIEPLIIVHGGAWDIPSELHSEHLKGIHSVLDTGIRILKKTDSSLLTVLEIIKLFEDNPIFDAGTGSFLNSDGEVEMDAGVMVGSDLSAGAVAAIRNVKHPIEIAEKIRSETQHVMLVGEGAVKFAQENGVQIFPTEDLLVGRERDLYFRLKEKKEVRIKSFFEMKKIGRDTVGAVVINSKGDIIAGTSTGGTPYKLKGRVGDSPLIGSGFYADNLAGGASTTGWGEGIMRMVMAKKAVDLMQNQMPAAEAAKFVIDELHNRIGGDGGIILIDNKGNYGCAYNTPYMARGVANINKILSVDI
jgi:beta-aspartyl-peptidase (threonine type)